MKVNEGKKKLKTRRNRVRVLDGELVDIEENDYLGIFICKVYLK